MADTPGQSQSFTPGGQYQSLQTGNLVLPYLDEGLKGIPTVVLRGRDRIRVMGRGPLAATATTIFTCVSPDVWTDVVVVAALLDASNRTFEFHHVPSGGSSGTTPIFGIGTPLKTTSTTLLMYGLGCEPGDFFAGLCSSASKVYITMYGVLV